MAKIQSETLVVTFNRLVKDDGVSTYVFPANDIVLAIEQVAQELAGDAVLVEVVHVAA